MIENIYKNRVFIFFSIIFLSLMIVNYYLNRSFVKEILINEQLNILKNSSDRIESWIDDKKLSLFAINTIILNYDPIKDEKTIKDVLQKSEEIAGFSSVYVGYENNITISSKIFNKPKNYIPTNRPWYKNTIKEDKFYITKPYVDVGLKIPVISICQNVKDSAKIKGVLCGILSFNDVKNEILDLRLENSGYVFLMDENFNILFHPNDKFQLQKANFDIKNPSIKQTSNYETDDEILTFKTLSNSHLILVAQTFKNNIYARINKQFLMNLVIYTISIFLFFTLAFFYNKKIKKQEELLEKTKREYEVLLFSQTKMAELGQMIASISHQWIQPLNSLGIFLGNLVQFKKLGALSDDIFYDNISRSLKNIDYMNDTMNTFKNFYKFQDKKQIFNVKQAILDTIFILFSQHSKIDIKVNVSNKIDLECENYLNEFKQIIACLIQNSKQAFLSNQIRKNAKIVISIRSDETHFLIRVIDNASGIADDYKDKIFKPFLSTKNSSGLGLYISKLIAFKKCNGDLTLAQAKRPTIFLLKIAKKV
ncbi:sensor histidine kinase [Campylobacter pinnipediorum]|uniref:Histidine kinase n=1 Tax=Campylobacter pinnipediorum subsp. pinnipediorum TaxID=1660067 RepID=A0AAX0LBW7_9BACT|nr:sensor histidine kinase [Campylobacter pinnipediorum]OPA81894.1 histidine kinase [Campylobacter pinnipediorum subsp. pinnipediorum]